MQVTVDVKIPSQREYKKMHWGMREAKKFELVEATKKALIIEDQPERFSTVLLVIGGTIFPEHCYISPIMAALRTTGWLTEECVISIQVSRKQKGILICL